MLLREKSVGRPYIITVGVIVMLLVWFVARAFPQSTVVQNEIAKSELQGTERSQALKPVFYEYRGITIGTPEAELLEKIDTKPRYKSEDDYFYVFSEAESAQFLLDAERKVQSISITYLDSDSGAPTYENVFGKDVAIRMTADGSVHNLVNYAEAGFWVAYYKSMGDSATVTIAIQKL